MAAVASRTTSPKLAPRDAEFVYNESRTHPGHLMASYFFDADHGACAEVTVQQAREWITSRFGHADLFTNRLRRVPMDLDYPRWVPAPTPDLAHHVTVEQVEVPGWSPVRAYLGKLLAQPLDLTRPPWELHVLCGVYGLDELAGRFTVVTLKIHHSAADGLAARELTRAMFSSAPKPAEPTGRRAVGRVGLLLRAASALPVNSGRFIRGLSRTGRAAEDVRVAEESGEISPIRADLAPTRFNRSLHGDISVDFVSFSLTQARVVQAAVPGVSLNDVYLAIVAGALAQYLDICGERPRDSLRAMVPRSMRGIMQWESANQLAILTVDLHTDEADPLARLAKIAASTATAKQRSEHPAVRTSGTRVETAPAWLLRLTGFAVRHYPHESDRGRQSHTTVSNIPLTVDDCTFVDSPAVAVIGGQAPVDGDALRHYLLAATGDRLILNIFSSSVSMPDPQTYARLIRQAYAELSEAAERAGEAALGRQT